MLVTISTISWPELTELIARKVGVRPCKVLLEKFANNETNVQLLDQVRCQDVYIIQTGEPLLPPPPQPLISSLQAPSSPTTL